MGIMPPIGGMAIGGMAIGGMAIGGMGGDAVMDAGRAWVPGSVSGKFGKSGRFAVASCLPPAGATDGGSAAPAAVRAEKRAAEPQ